MNYELIKERAEIIFDIIEDKIDYDFDCESTDYLDAYKATFALKNKSITLFKRAFRNSSYNFCIHSVEAVYENLCDELPGYSGLSFEEKEILRELLEIMNGGRQASFNL